LVALTDRLGGAFGLVTTMARAGIIAPLRPDKYLRIAAAMARENMGITSGFAAAAQRCPDRAGLVDDIGMLTWREIDQRADAFASALQAFVVLTDGASTSPDELKAHVRENLANYKVPRNITVLEGLPRGSTGKILRRELQERHANDGDGS
jgi:acyl-CoA synthetase (AMP-forming)/AMP-acid ligase II